MFLFMYISMYMNMSMAVSVFMSFFASVGSKNQMKIVLKPSGSKETVKIGFKIVSRAIYNNLR
jgi:hypothetical protein